MTCHLSRFVNPVSPPYWLPVCTCCDVIITNAVGTFLSSVKQVKEITEYFTTTPLHMLPLKPSR